MSYVCDKLTVSIPQLAWLLCAKLSVWRIIFTCLVSPTAQSLRSFAWPVLCIKPVHRKVLMRYCLWTEWQLVALILWVVRWLSSVTNSPWEVYGGADLLAVDQQFLTLNAYKKHLWRCVSSPCLGCTPHQLNQNLWTGEPALWTFVVPRRLLTCSQSWKPRICDKITTN